MALSVVPIWISIRESILMDSVTTRLKHYIKQMILVLLNLEEVSKKNRNCMLLRKLLVLYRKISLDRLKIRKKLCTRQTPIWDSLTLIKLLGTSLFQINKSFILVPMVASKLNQKLVMKAKKWFGNSKTSTTTRMPTKKKSLMTKTCKEKQLSYLRASIFKKKDKQGRAD